MQFGEPNEIGNMRSITPAVKYIIILNVILFVTENWFGIPFRNMFALPANWIQTVTTGGVFKVFTYMFVHANFMHLLMNMVTLFFIGPTVERTIGSYRFFILYYLSGVLGGLGWSLFAQSGSCIGASGAVMGVLGAFGALYPRSTVYLWLVIPIKTWVLVLGLALWELHEMMGDPKVGGVANAAHLMGGIAGFCYAFYLKHPHIIEELKQTDWKKALRSKKRTASPSGDQLSRAEIDSILKKIGKEGMGALTPRERDLLNKATRR